MQFPLAEDRSRCFSQSRRTCLRCESSIYGLFLHARSSSRPELPSSYSRIVTVKRGCYDRHSRWLHFADSQGEKNHAQDRLFSFFFFSFFLINSPSGVIESHSRLSYFQWGAREILLPVCPFQWHRTG